MNTRVVHRDSCMCDECIKLRTIARLRRTAPRRRLTPIPIDVAARSGLYRWLTPWPNETHQPWEIDMPSYGFYCYRRHDTRKVWRYPGVPIPERLKHRYKPT